MLFSGLTSSLTRFFLVLRCSDDQKVLLVLYGKLENLSEMRELYDLLPPGEDPLDFNATSESAELLMAMYLRVRHSRQCFVNAPPLPLLESLYVRLRVVIVFSSSMTVYLSRYPLSFSAAQKFLFRAPFLESISSRTSISMLQSLDHTYSLRVFLLPHIMCVLAHVLLACSRKTSDMRRTPLIPLCLQGRFIEMFPEALDSVPVLASPTYN